MKIPKNIKAVIFDMDGLLIDSEPYWQKADSDFFANYGKKFNVDMHTVIRGMGQKEIVEYYIKKYNFPNKRDELIKERKKLLYKYLLKNLVLLRGAGNIVKKLFSKKYQLAVATSGHSRKKTKEILAKCGLEEYFSVLESGENVEKSKPDPEIYLKTSNLLEVSPKKCLVLEDAPNGVLAGKSAGMLVYGINIDKFYQKELNKAGADEVFASLSEIEV